MSEKYYLKMQNEVAKLRTKILSKIKKLSAELEQHDPFSQEAMEINSKLDSLYDRLTDLDNC